MRSGRTVGRAFAKVVKEPLQSTHPRYYHPYRQHIQDVQQAEVVQVAVLELRLVVPFHLNTHAIFEIIDFVRGDRNRVSVNRDLDVEGLWTPAHFPEGPVNGYRDRRTPASRREDVAPPERERAQCGEDFVKLLAEIASQDCGCVSAFIKAETCPDVFRY